MGFITRFIHGRRRLSTVGALILTVLVVGHLWRLHQADLDDEEVIRNRFQDICSEVGRTVAEVDPNRWEEPWQYVEEDDDLIYLYSAVLYTRRLDTGVTHQQVKVIAVGTDPQRFTPHCLLWYPEELSPRTTPAMVVTVGRPYPREDGEATWYQYVLTCTLRLTNPLPTHVSVVTQPCMTPETFVAIHAALTDGVLHQFGVCVPAAAGDWDPVHLVEWFEVQRAMGVSEFHIYNMAISKRSTQHLRHYIDAGIVRLRPLPPPEGTASLQGAPLLDAASLTDCLLRNMLRYRVLIVVDINDVIVPRRAASYSLMLSSLSRGILDVQPDSFNFQGAVFNTDCTEKTRGGSVLFKYLRRSEPVSLATLGRFPFMLDPRKCVVLTRRGCAKHSSRSLSFAWEVKPEVAVYHHYQPPEGDKCDANVSRVEEGVRDDVLLNYRLRVMAASPVELSAWKNLT